MATPASQTINLTLAQALQYANLTNQSIFQPQLDNLLIAAKDNAAAEGVDKTVIVQITPPGATQLGFTGGIKWSQETCREYLYPPGDSTRVQPDVNNAMMAACNQATATSKITQGTIVVHPT